MFLSTLIVFLAHFLGDYPLQNDFLAKGKSKSRYLLFVHCFIWASLVYVALSAFGLASPWKFFFLISIHGIVDEWKCRTFVGPRELKKTLGITMTGLQAFFVDQTAHALQLIVVLIS